MPKLWALQMLIGKPAHVDILSFHDMKIVNENLFASVDYPEFNATVLGVILYRDSQYWVKYVFLIGVDFVDEITETGPHTSHALAKDDLLNSNKAWHIGLLSHAIDSKALEKRKSLESRDRWEIREAEEKRIAKENAEKLKAKREKAHQYYLRRKERIKNGEPTNPKRRGPKIHLEEKPDWEYE
jgi:hypothetical protein